jgi:rare lipoprotein A
VRGAYDSPATASGARAGPDAAPGHDLDPEHVADALPRTEPRSRYGNGAGKAPCPACYQVFGKTYEVLASADGYRERGFASWYGAKFHGAKTSSGEPYDMYLASAAHRTLPLPSYVEVTNLENGHRVVVRVNDRGPFHDNRVMDLSYAAALKLDIVRKGTGLVELRALSAAEIAAAERAAPAVAPAPSTGAPADPAPAVVASTAPLPEAPPLAAQPIVWIQVGAYGSRANAERVAGQLAAAGLGAATLIDAGDTQRTLVKVRLGPYPSAEALDAATRALAGAGFPAPQLVFE